MKSSNLELKKLQRTQGKKIRTLLLFSLICLMIGVFFELFQNEDFLKIKSVTVEGTHGYVNKNDIETVVKGSTLGKSVFSVDTQKIEQDLKNNFLGARSFKVSKTLSGRINVRVSERRPIALLVQKYNTFVVDDDGYVLGYMDPSTTNLPKIKYEENIKIGYFIDKALVPIYSDIIAKLDEAKIKVSSISVNEYDVKMYVDSGTEVIISRKNYNGSFSTRLKEALNYLKTSGKSARSIDLRYDKVILSFN